MKFSYNKIQTYFDTKLPSPEELAEALTFSFAEVESVQKEGDDSILDIKVLPDRAGYAKSYDGIAMEVGAVIDFPARLPQPNWARTISIRVRDINQVLGTELKAEEIASILTRLCITETTHSDEMILNIPENRTDLQDWRDIAEEVGRIHGYDKIKAEMPPAIGFKPKVDKIFYYSEKIKNLLIEKGFSEVYTYSLVPKGDFEVEKPLASDKNFLRTNLTDGLSKSLELNAKNADLLGLGEIKIFEIGRVFKKEAEHTSLAIGIKNLKKKDEKEKDKIKKVRDELLKIIDANATILCTVDDSGGIISIGNKQIGVTNNVEGITELNLDELVATLPEPASYDDLKLGKSSSVEYKKFSHYPFIVRDIAVLVPESVSAEEVWQNIKTGIENSGTSELLANYSLFDTFKKDGKTSYAFRMVFQSHDKTLTDEEANSIMVKVNEKVKGSGWEVR